jgi:Matrixin
MRYLYLLGCVFLLTTCYQELEPLDPLNPEGFILSEIESIKTPLSNCVGLFTIKNTNQIKLPAEESRDAIWGAFENWQEKESGLFFREIQANETPDLEINFGNNPEVFKGKSKGSGFLKFPVGGLLCGVQFVNQKPILWLNSSYSWNKIQITAVVGFLIGRAYGLSVTTDKNSILQNNLLAITQNLKPSFTDIDSLQKKNKSKVQPKS